MKLYHKSILLSALIAFSLLTACNGDDDEPTPTPTPTANASMKATIDGNAWTATKFQNTLIKATDGIGDGKRMDLRGTSADGKMIIISLADYSTGKNGDGVAMKTYSFEGATDDALFTYMVNNSVKHMPESGSVTITANNSAAKTVSGNFFFESRLTGDTTILRVTAGSFSNLVYTVHQ